MTQPLEEIRRRVRQWVAFAEEDLRLAEHALTMPAECPHRLVAYHAQQCAEKYLKAFLVLRGVDFPYTHNISVLLELSAEAGPWLSDLHEAESLTAYAVTARYPGVEQEVTDADAREAIGNAREVRRTVREELTRSGVELAG
jgi:HEPN domain-containing protein